MKKTFYLSFVAVLTAVALISCNKIIEEEIIPEDPSIEEPTAVVNSLTFAIQDEEATKAILNADGEKKHGEWEEGDKIGTIVSDKTSIGYSDILYPIPVKFSVSCEEGFEVGDKIYAWYPYISKRTNPRNVEMSIPTDQNMVEGKLDFSAMPMVAKEIAVNQDIIDAGTAVINFYNLGALISFKVFASSSYTTEKVLSVTFNASGNIAGSFSKDLTAINSGNESTFAISGNTGTSVKTNVIPFKTAGSSSSKPLDVYMVVAPGAYSGSIVVETDVATYTWVLPEKEFQRSHVRSFGLQLDKASGVTRVEHVKGSFTWDLTKVSFESASTTSVSWPNAILSMEAAKGSASTNTNNYLPPSYSSTRFYNNSTLSFTPGSLWIEKVVFTASSPSYANVLAGSSWTNASASASESSVTIIPTDGANPFSATIGNTTGHKSAKVYYDNTNYTLSGVCSPAAGGSFTIKKGEDDVTSAKVNSTITLNATPNDGYNFTGWSVVDAESNPVSVDGNSFKMPASNVTVTASFVEATEPKTITITPVSNGTVTTDPSGTAYPGETVTITATPNSGYSVVSIVVTDEDSGDVDVASNQFIMPSKGVTVTVSFSANNTWTRVTSVSQITSGGTFIIGYENSAKSGVLIPMRQEDAAASNNYIRSGTSAGESTNGTITMASSMNPASTAEYEAVIVAGKASGNVSIKVGPKFIQDSATSSSNKCSLSDTQIEETDFTPTIGDNDVVTFTSTRTVTKNSKDYHPLFQFNNSNGSYRFTCYTTGGQKNLVLYKKN